MKRDKPTDAEREFMSEQQDMSRPGYERYVTVTDEYIEAEESVDGAPYDGVNIPTEQLLKALERAGILRRAGWVRK